MSTASVFDTAVRSLQLVLNSIGANLNVDGVFGPLTSRAIANLKDSDRRLIKNLADRLGIEMPKMISWDSVNRIVARVCREKRVPEQYVLRLLMIENQTTTSGILIDTLGKYRGLGQFDRATWKAVTNSPWERVTDPQAGIEAVCDLYLANKNYHERKFKNNWTNEIAYLYHNQGASAAAQFLTSGELRYPKQSGEAMDTFRIARTQHVNNRTRDRGFA